MIGAVGEQSTPKGSAGETTGAESVVLGDVESRERGLVASEATAEP